MLDVRKLRLLREVSVHGSMTGAANSFGVSVSSVSQQISKLEMEQGLPLVEADGRGVRLTPAAHMLVARTENILSALEEAEAELQHNREARSGAVHLVTFHTFATGFLGEVVRHLAEIAPLLTLRFTQLDPVAALPELTARRADIVVADEYDGYSITPTQGIVRSVLGTDPIQAYFPHPGAAPHATAWAMEPACSDATRWAVGLCRGAGFEPQIRFESPDPYVHAELVRQGVAAAFLPVMVAEKAGLTPYSSPDFSPELSRRFVALARRGSEQSPAVAACQKALEFACAPLLPREEPAPGGIAPPRAE